MTSVIPKLDDRLEPVMFITQGAQASGAQQEPPSGRRADAEPPGGKYPQKMAARKNQRITGNAS